MLRSLLLLFLFFLFLVSSVAVPFVATLGYVWLDLLQPQTMSYVLFISSMPVAMIMGLAAVGTYMSMDRKFVPPVTPEFALLIAMAIWITFTSFALAVAPELVWDKWDWAFKTIVFTAFVPFVIRSKVQIEAFLQIFLLSLAANFMPFGAKVLISGGGYGVNLGLQGGNGGLAEGGLLSTACLMTVPLALHLATHQQILPRPKIARFLYWIMAGLAIATAVGTYERSALIGMAILGVVQVFRSKNKFLPAVAVACVAVIIAISAGSAYKDRMATIETYQSEGSAEARLRIWQWTLGYAVTHPLGGGFYAYTTSVVEVPGNDKDPAHVEIGRAYHSSYFEVLGEQGFPGLGMFLGLALLVFKRLRRMRRMTKNVAGFEWVASLCSAIEVGFAVFFSSGAFVSLSFQPMLWYFIAMTLALNGYMYHAARAAEPAERGWARGQTPVTSSPLFNGWRNKGPAVSSRMER
jgi:probable O-glycosylation ligase (exosortase A-associated)